MWNMSAANVSPDEIGSLTESPFSDNTAQRRHVENAKDIAKIIAGVLGADRVNFSAEGSTEGAPSISVTVAQCVSAAPAVEAAPEGQDVAAPAVAPPDQPPAVVDPTAETPPSEGSPVATQPETVAQVPSDNPSPSDQPAPDDTLAPTGAYPASPQTAEENPTPEEV